MIALSPAICTDPRCSYTTEMEPDQDRGYCEAWGNNAVATDTLKPCFWPNSGRKGR